MKQYKQQQWGIWAVSKRGYGEWIGSFYAYRGDVMRQLKSWAMLLPDCKITAERVTLPPPDRVREQP